MVLRLDRATRDFVRRLVGSNEGMLRWLSTQEQRLVRWRHSAATIAPAVIRPQTRNITVALTAACNLRCVGCRYGRDFMPQQELPLALVRDLIDDAGAAGVDNVRLYGGEPLLYRELPQVVEYALDRGVDPYVTTNGVLLERRIDDLYAAGLRFLSLGFYGVEDAYDAYVHRKGAFAAVERSIAAVRDRYGDDVELRLNWLLMRPTCNDAALDAVIEFAERYRMAFKVDLVHYSLPYFTEGPDRELQFRLEDRSAIEHITTRLLALREERPERIEQSVAGLRSIPDWLILGPKMRVPCDKYEMLWVGADGSVQLCYVTFPMGNLHDTRLRNLLFTAEHRRAAQGAFKLDCPNCHCGYDSRVLKHGPSLRRYG